MASVEFDKEQLAFFPFHVIFKRNANDKPTLNSLSEEGKRPSGFPVNWFIVTNNGSRVSETLPARQEDWKKETLSPAYR